MHPTDPLTCPQSHVFPCQPVDEAVAKERGFFIVEWERGSCMFETAFGVCELLNGAAPSLFLHHCLLMTLSK